MTKIKLIKAPTDADWMEVKRRALVTVGKKPVAMPDSEWKHKILEARHSPIRYLTYSFYLEGLPSWVSVHLARHIHAQPYIKSQRNDRQDDYNRNAARQDAPVSMIWDINAEELQVIANKRLCGLAAPETREVVKRICELAEKATPELKGLLVPMCEHCGGVCHEMNGCGRNKKKLSKPLTLDQLREMDGLPVWVSVPVRKYSNWGIVDFNFKRILPFFKEDSFWDFSNFGEWLAYEYPPAYIDREAWEPCKKCAIDVNIKYWRKIDFNYNFCPNCGAKMDGGNCE